MRALSQHVKRLLLICVKVFRFTSARRAGTLPLDQVFVIAQGLQQGGYLTNCSVQSQDYHARP